MVESDPVLVDWVFWIRIRRSATRFIKEDFEVEVVGIKELITRGLVGSTKGTRIGHCQLVWHTVRGSPRAKGAKTQEVLIVYHELVATNSVGTTWSA